MFHDDVRYPFSFLLSYIPCGFTYLDGQLLVVGVLDEPYSQQTPFSGEAVQARQSTVHRLEPCPVYVAWRAGMATPLSGLS
jgi:hypothetical protein